MASTEHALLSASSAHRWLTCTPSARLEQEFGHSECSIYAEEGTAAHALAEIKELYRFGKIGPMEYATKLDEWHANEKFEKYYSKELEEYVDDFVQFVENTAESYNEYNIYFELKVNFSNIVPQGFGTADVLIVTDDTIHVIDLKFGKGIPVSAINNPQLRLYGIGALNLFPGSKIIKTTICQPRLESNDTECLDKKELLDWAFNYVIPRAEEAIKGTGKLNPTEDACRFCKLRGECKERADMALNMAKKEFAVENAKDNFVQNMSPERISEILQIAPMFIDWFKDVQAYALGQLMRGIKIPGYKIVEGRSNRIVTNPEKVGEILKSVGLKDEQIFKPKELQSLTNLEKLVGKKLFNDLCSDYIIKPVGKLTLAPEDDRRQEVSTVELAQQEFAESIE